jgi:glycosyltransferase involved in cell wall biosynthesis
MKASVIIPTRNRAEVLAPCLESLARQTLAADAFEVLVVDNGSTDHTADVVAGFASRLDVARHFAAEPGLHVGRHAGMRQARSDVLMFADDDIVAGPDWVRSVVDAFADARVGLVGGNNLPLFEATPPTWLQRWWERPAGPGRALGYLSILDFGEGRFAVDPRYVWGCNFSVRREALLAAGGFHPDAMPRERLPWRGDGESHVAVAVRDAGYAVLFDSGASVQHRVGAERMTRAYFEQRGFAQGVSDSYAAVRRGGRPVARHERMALAMRRWRQGLQAWRRSAGDDVERELQAVQRAAARAYWDGFRFHQRRVADDPALLAWVLRPDYLQ